jgi:hypothetical protein
MKILNFLLLVIIGSSLAEVWPPHPVAPPKPEDLPSLAVATSSCPTDKLKGIDLVFAMDVSASVGQARYAAGMKFIENVVDSLNGHIGTGAGQTQVAMMEFDEMQYTMFELNTFTNAPDIQKFLHARNYNQNGTNSLFAKAVDYSLEKMFVQSRGGDFDKVLAFVTDGWTDESQKDLVAARLRAQADHVTIFYFFFAEDASEKSKESLVGNNHLADRAFPLTGFHDIALLTGCNTTDTPGFCKNGGTPGCHCPPGYTGKHCEIAINWCKIQNRPPVNHDGNVTGIDFCHSHGDCVYNNETGSHCVCHPPWTGKWCENLTDDGAVSRRCIAYTTNYTDTHDNAIKYLCDLSDERCIPDNIDCALNVPIKYVDGKPRCDDAHNGCKCKYPIGWCIPLEAGNHIIKGFVLPNAYLDPYFTGSS